MYWKIHPEMLDELRAGWYPPHAHQRTAAGLPDGSGYRVPVPDCSGRGHHAGF